MYKILVTTIVEGRSSESSVGISVVELEFDTESAADKATERMRGTPNAPMYVSVKRTVEKLY